MLNLNIINFSSNFKLNNLKIVFDYQHNNFNILIPLIFFEIYDLEWNYNDCSFNHNLGCVWDCSNGDDSKYFLFKNVLK